MVGGTDLPRFVVVAPPLSVESSTVAGMTVIKIKRGWILIVDDMVVLSIAALVLQACR
jgi:hypothetical protein